MDKKEKKIMSLKLDRNTHKEDEKPSLPKLDLDLSSTMKKKQEIKLPELHLNTKKHDTVVDSKTASEDSANELSKDIVESSEQVITDDSDKSSKEAASELVVTQDGKTLEEMLKNIRGGRKRLDQQMEEIKSKESAIVVNGNEKEDSIYTKHASRLENEKKKDEGRIKNSKGYIQKNSRYTEEEKILMKNLGLTPKEFVRVMSKNSKLTKRDKDRLIAIGQAGGDRFFKGKRFRATLKDRDILIFLAKFKFANTRILSRLSMEPYSKTWRKLTRLKEGGLVVDREMIGMGTIWFLTEAGMAMTGYEFKTWRQKTPKTSTLPPVIGANHVAACLWNNSFNILGLDDFPAKNKLVPHIGEDNLQQGEMLISEYEIRSALGKQTYKGFENEPGRAGMFAEVSDKANAIWHEWKVNGMSKDSPEFEIGSEYLWTLYPQDNMTGTYHVPDLVVARPRDEDGSPNSIAVEIELNQKSRQQYRKILMAYKLFNHVYGKVIWVTHTPAIAKVLSEVAAEINLDNFDVVPMANEKGDYKNRDIWHI